MVQRRPSRTFFYLVLPYRLPADLAAYSPAKCLLPRACARCKTALRAAGPFTFAHKARASASRASICFADKPIRHHFRTSVLVCVPNRHWPTRATNWHERAYRRGGQHSKSLGKPASKSQGRPYELLNLPVPGATNRQVKNLESVMAGLFKIVSGMIRDLTDLYRPERHYMRGPGPAWRAKHPEAA